MTVKVCPNPKCGFPTDMAGRLYCYACGDPYDGEEDAKQQMERVRGMTNDELFEEMNTNESEAAALEYMRRLTGGHIG